MFAEQSQSQHRPQRIVLGQSRTVRQSVPSLPSAPPRRSVANDGSFEPNLSSSSSSSSSAFDSQQFESVSYSTPLDGDLVDTPQPPRGGSAKVEHSPPPVVDVFCSRGIKLAIHYGYVESGRIYAGGPREREGSGWAPREYADVSLHIQSEPGSDGDVGGTLRVYLASTQNYGLPLLAHIPAKDIVLATVGSRSAADSNKLGVALHGLWVDVLDCEARRKGAAMKQSVVTLQFHFTDRTVRDRVLQTLEDCHRRSRGPLAALRQDEETGPQLLRQTLSSVRALKQQTLQMLESLREEHTPWSTGRTVDDVFDAAEETAARRHTLDEAQSHLHDIQARRRWRAEKVHSILESSVKPPGGGDNKWEPLATPTTEVVVQVPSSSRLRTVPRATTPSSSRNDARSPGEDLLCRHCGESCSSRSELKAHQPQCAFRMVRCRRCKLTVKAKEFQKHRQTKCVRGVRRTPSLSSLNEVSSSSMEELSSQGSSRSLSSLRSDPALRSPRSDSTRSLRSDATLRSLRSDSTLQSLRSGRESYRAEIPRSQSRSKFRDVAVPMQRRTSSPPSSFRGRSPPIEAMDYRLPAAFSRERSSTLQRKGSTLELVDERCPHCGKVAPATHFSRCAHRIVACAVCGERVKARDALDHAVIHR